MAYTMTHKEIAKALALKQMRRFWDDAQKQKDVIINKKDRPTLGSLYYDHSSRTEGQLLDALERFKAWLGTSEVDDLISAAEKNLSDLAEETP